jgi:hypothetical protein
MLPFYLYASGLMAAAAIALATAIRHDNAQLARSVLAVTANWLAGVGFNLATGITDGWWFNIAIDAAAAAVIMYRPASRPQSILGVTYCVQIAMHCGYGLLNLLHQPVDPMPYYNWLTGIAWVQLLILGGWSGGLWFDLRWARGNPDIARAGVQNMDEA